MFGINSMKKKDKLDFLHSDLSITGPAPLIYKKWKKVFFSVQKLNLKKNILV